MTSEARFGATAEVGVHRLDLTSQRVGHEAVDQDEVGGYSGIYSKDCTTAEYAIRAGTFKKTRIADQGKLCEE